MHLFKELSQRNCIKEYINNCRVFKIKKISIQVFQNHSEIVYKNSSTYWLKQKAFIQKL